METSTGIHVRQDRFLETGPAEPKDNETLWSGWICTDCCAFRWYVVSHRHIPLNILSVDSTGKGIVNKAVVLKERENTFELDTSKPFKLNAGTTGTCEFFSSSISRKLMAESRSTVI
jgi:aminopeptidase 2